MQEARKHGIFFLKNDLTLDGLIEKLLKKEWCKQIVFSCSKLKRKIIDFYIDHNFEAHLSEACSMVQFLQKTNNLHDLLQIVSSQQIKAVSQFINELQHTSSPQPSHRVASNDPTSFIFSEELSNRISFETRQRTRAIDKFHTIFEIISRYSESDFEKLSIKLGIESVLQQLSNNEERTLYLITLFAHPDTVSCMGLWSIVPVQDAFRDDCNKIEEAKKCFDQWKQYKHGFGQFITTHVFTESQKARAIELYNKGDYTAVVYVFNQGSANIFTGTTANLKTVLKNLLRRALEQLKEKMLSGVHQLPVDMSENDCDEPPTPATTLATIARRKHLFDEYSKSPANIEGLQSLFVQTTNDLLRKREPTAVAKTHFKECNFCKSSFEVIKNERTIMVLNQMITPEKYNEIALKRESALLSEYELQICNQIASHALKNANRSALI